MASRWRTWDADYYIDAHTSKMPEETEPIPAVGHGRGKPAKDVASLNLPKAALGITKDKNTAQAPATGRGRASVMKARALTDLSPIRRPGEKKTTAATSVIEEDLSSLSDGSDVIIIENFPPNIKEQDLIDLFDPYGDVLSCMIDRDGKGISQGTSLIRMESRTVCEWIVNTFSGEVYPGQKKFTVLKWMSDLF
ncbi:Protein alan shepard [Stylophora pistillata]|uniref:Protein alan shepard n=1 Tax=Stylophora pistillata TaxID=50429 RepID=A0A2B4RJI6_STYPI|nr:Protein alan shepard [Stylophora pistillata]